ncbi:UDP-N-acetylmuramate--L-alanine ligase [Myroides pelagicus]|uniref:UDP-N-acetylmuramate--L-alanine ligase n=1 Tax=Myroides pelagicus TaxID=270914 RepID=UPI002DBFA3FF|nr:UDP-N-acetylmuramate--L-alanine ligase [Myroides pelagicus]MEC4114518.1 UDP-N-acetylmuramate--L-alanine ligase [Myroides pelagicus]
MKTMDQIKSVYFIGIGGIGMSALARYFKYLGKNVAGYDKTATQLTGELESIGIDIHYEDSIELVSNEYKHKESTIVVVTPAIPVDHSEWLYFKESRFEILKRSEVLGIITKDTYCFAVAGTHGKTTTTSILGHLLFESGVDVTAFVGGVVENYQTNLIGSGTTVTVVEADEFDRSFLRLSPNVACVNSTEADHLDIFGTADEMLKSFKEFADKVVDDKKLYINESVDFNGVKVGFDEGCSFRIVNIKVDNGWYCFDIITPKEVIEDVRFGLPGHHNLSNALVAFAMAYDYGVEKDLLVAALASFKGVRRRFSYKVRRDDFVFIDDYAHHPTEIKAVSQAVHEMYGDKKILAIFQPHLYSRTNDFMDEFAQALSTFENVILMDIYPAREAPIEGVTSEKLLSLVTSKGKELVAKNALVDYVKSFNPEVLVTIGAGDIGEMINTLKAELE